MGNVFSSRLPTVRYPKGDDFTIFGYLSSQKTNDRQMVYEGDPCAIGFQIGYMKNAPFSYVATIAAASQRQQASNLMIPVMGVLVM